MGADRCGRGCFVRTALVDGRAAPGEDMMSERGAMLVDRDEAGLGATYRHQ
jgi:hypothetical protein